MGAVVAMLFSEEKNDKRTIVNGGCAEDALHAVNAMLLCRCSWWV
jgi:hypothetical protein